MHGTAQCYDMGSGDQKGEDPKGPAEHDNGDEEIHEEDQTHDNDEMGGVRKRKGSVSLSVASQPKRSSPMHNSETERHQVKCINNMTPAQQVVDMEM